MAISISVNPSPFIEDEDEEPTDLYEILETPRSVRSVNATVTVLIPSSGDDEGPPSPPTIEIISITVTPTTFQQNVRITEEANNVTKIQGTYRDPFSDIFNYVERGSSDLLETPKTVVGIVNLPSQKDFYNLAQDTTERTTVFYDMVVIYKNTVTQLANTEHFQITHDIYNEWDGMTSFVADYYS